MGLGTSKAAKTDAVFVDLKFAPSKGEQMVGFRQTVGRTPREGAKEGERKFDYEYRTHDYVNGKIVGFRIKEEPSYDDPKEKLLVAYTTVRDVGTQPSPDVVIRFPLLSQAGRRMVGLMAAAMIAKAKSVHLYTNYADAGSQIGNKVLDKPQAYLNCKVGNAHGAKLVPLYYDEKGNPLLDAEGNPAKLPMGEKHVIARKEVWDFTRADEIVAATAAALEDRLKHDASDRMDASDYIEDDQHGEHGGDDDDVDLNEAAGAAMRG